MLRIGVFHCMLNNMIISQQLHTSSQTVENMSIPSKQFTLQTFFERKYFTLRSLMLAVAKLLIWGFYTKVLSHCLYLWLLSKRNLQSLTKLLNSVSSYKTLKIKIKTLNLPHEQKIKKNPNIISPKKKYYEVF